MILDQLSNAAKYTGLKVGLSEAFGFLDQPGVTDLPDGTYEILGTRVYAIVSRTAATPPEGRLLEAHRRYIDIQFVLSGEEEMGWSPRAGRPCAVEYDPEKDIEFLEGAPEAVVRVPPGCFAVFMPSDAHLPLIGNGNVHKIVVKVAIS